MTNEEINLAIAAIQGWVFVPPEMGRYGQMTYPKWRHSGGAEYVSETPPPYATDWQWCGPLVEKYDLDVMENLHGGGELTPEGKWPRWYVDACDGVLAYDDDVKRAICLAVITAQPTPATLQAAGPTHDSDRS